ncbi:universal stress protein [Flavobacterium sp.]|uniref:universal stress protein n=1 Tax=Flavobacterium sp. TaxID=239 RepID=UPI0011FFEBE4|nr:universal stress protein [Flavobacterium sp.]RZJ70756.1 MAG: universal stress protein [Flavobacterium sp.]
MLKKILFPTDFSEASKNAFVYALQLAKHIEATIVTLHVYEMPAANYVDVPAYLMEVYDTVELANFENYKGQIPVLRQIALANGCENVPIENVLLDGDLVNSILQIVKTDNIDYVVMGTKGASGVKETFLGTSTANVMTRTNAFVLGVPEDSTYTPIRKITFTTRFREKDLPALKQLLPLAEAFGATIDCLHVNTPASDAKEVVIANWQLLMKDKNVNFHIIENEFVEESILDFIHQNGSDLLALLNHKRGFFEGLFHTSLTKKLAFHSRIPVLAIHE